VAIICGRHTQKDQFNTLGSERFANDTGQKLTNFYSIDKWGKEVDPSSKTKWGKSKAASKTKHQSNEIDFDDQLHIWRVRHGGTENFAGKLSLCIAMPVMLRNNDATELCITKGQEGFVAGWNSRRGPHGKRVLETLFVKLDNPPQNVMIPGLPQNVVPIMMATKTVECIFPNDMKESIERQQVWVLPNFGMTVFAAQGKTRPYNVVHLNSCYTHMAYYTALSRSASAAGTIILQGFDPSKITRSCSGYLRQEFRELEILDDITTLRFDNDLPETVLGNFRNSMIRSYQIWRGINYVPEKTDRLLRWSANDPMELLPEVKEPEWHIIDKSKKKAGVKPATSYIPAKGSKPVVSKHVISDNDEPEGSSPKKKLKSMPSKSAIDKHVISDNDDAKVSPAKKKQKTSNTVTGNLPSPLGLVWDQYDYSCSYDSLFVVLYNIWIMDPDNWSEEFDSINDDHLGVLSEGFKLVLEGHASLEDIRDTLRVQLHELDGNKFPMGQRGASVGDLASIMLQSDRTLTESQIMCSACGYAEDKTPYHMKHFLIPTGTGTPSTLAWVSDLYTTTKRICPNCSNAMIKKINYIELPKLLVLEYPNTTITTSHEIKLVVNDETAVLHLRGIVYHGENHFTCRIISSEGDMWYHDGMTTGNRCATDIGLNISTDANLKTCKGKRLVLVIYA
jgi:hypothetical protein